MNFQTILAVSADRPDQLRSIDVERVLTEAAECNVFTEFRDWLLQQDLQKKTRNLILSYNEAP